MDKIGFGGGCHWCTEAVFQSLHGVTKVEQGWIASDGDNGTYSEAVLVYFDNKYIGLDTLVAIHLYTHSCTSSHKMRNKYRSAIYTFTEEQDEKATTIIADLQSDFDKPIITQVIPFVSFKENQERYQNYYQNNSKNQFCINYIIPKLDILRQKFSKNFESVL
jgi:peptide-methionine (S)-S-oxide reductase